MQRRAFFAALAGLAAARWWPWAKPPRSPYTLTENGVVTVQMPASQTVTLPPASDSVRLYRIILDAEWVTIQSDGRQWKATPPGYQFGIDRRAFQRLELLD